MILHGVAVQNQDFNADGVFTYDLGVNPLSVILLAMRPLNDTGTLTNFARWANAVQSLNRVTVRHRGQSIISMTGRDAAALSVFRHGYQPWMANTNNTNNERICAVLPIFLGRRPYDPMSCFPATRRGELVLEIDVDDADTGYDDLQMTVETIELLDAKPSHFERKVQLSQTFAATGINDVDLPLGNVVRGLLCFGTTGFTGAAPAPTLGRMQIVADGVGIGYTGTDFEVAHQLQGLMGHGIPSNQDHVHIENTAGAYAQNATTGLPFGFGRDWLNYSYLNLDPWHDDAHSVDTGQVSRFQLRTDAEAANAVRIIPVERIVV
jgi:hypothetical protein